MTDFLANKLVAPLALAACLILAILLGVQTVRLNGVSFFGWYAIEGYKPQLEALRAQNLQAKVDQATAQLKENKARITSLDDANKSLAAQLSALHAKWDGYTPQEIIKYVPKEVLTACVPVQLLWLLDAAGTGSDLSTAAPRPGESGSACAPLGVLGSESALMQNIKHFPELTARIENGYAAWEAQRKVNETPTP